MRRLSDLLEAGEELSIAERLGLGGWWALSDRALYAIGRRGTPRRFLLEEIRSVTVKPGSVTVLVTVTTANGDAVVGDLHGDRPLVARLRDLAP